MIDSSRAVWGGPADPPCVLASLARAVSRHPCAVAVADEHGEHTYPGLLAWVGDVAARLRAAGVGERDRVAVTGPRSAASVAAFLATMTLGATYVPLDPEYPPQRLRFMLTDSQARVLVHTGAAPAGWGAGEATVLPVPAPPAGEPTAAWSPVACEPDLPIYVIYTSGSTGWPKGVAVAHRCLDNMAEWQVHHSPRTRLRTAQFAPLNFDVYFQEVLGSLCGGGSVVIAPERLRRDPLQLLSWLVEQRIERLFLPYVALQMLAVAAELEPSPLDLSLVEIDTAGEQLVCTPQIRRLFARLPGARLVNHYGQSESAMVSSHVLTGPSQGWPALPPIGVPLPGCELLVDATDPDAPDVGELLVAGLPVSLGYLDRPELNAERYIEIAQTPRGHTRAFRTGDLVRLDGGVVSFLSRVDDEVKVRGVRVDLLEIDALLLEQPGVRAAAAVLVRGPVAATLRAAISVAADAAWDEAAVLRELARTLPEVSVPRSIIVVEELPRTPSGKIDRAAVSELVRAATSGVPTGF